MPAIDVLCTCEITIGERIMCFGFPSMCPGCGHRSYCKDAKKKVYNIKKDGGV